MEVVLKKRKKVEEKAIELHHDIQEPEVGDKIYVDKSSVFEGGQATISDVVRGNINGKPTTFISVHECQNVCYNWKILSLLQDVLENKFTGKERRLF